MTRNRSTACDNLIDYLFGELSDHDRVVFEHHAKHCKSCREELDLVVPIHERLSEADSELPSQAWFSANRERLLQPILGIDTHNSTMEPVSRKTCLQSVGWRLRRKALWPTVAAMAILIAGGSLYWFRREDAGTSVQAPVSLEKKMTLRPNSLFPNARGVALLVNNQSKTNLIVYVSNAPQQDAWGCYDVWGVNGGKRYSLGEFTVDGTGNGALLVGLPTSNHYDFIEVTLEPGWGDAEPKGPQVFAGPWTNA